VGWLASLPLVAMQTGGLIMGQQMGLGFARLYNPDLDDEGDVLGQMLFLMALAGFLIVGGHEAMVLAVLRSFEHVPLGGLALDESLLVTVNGVLLAALELALRVSAPVLVVIFLESLAMGFMAKTVPQLNILSLGFPLRILVGLAVVMVGLSVIDDVMMDSIDWTLEVIFRWIEGG
jgi:flagellar biosynthetic protein FliR